MIELPERKEGSLGALLRLVCGLSAFHTFTAVRTLALSVVVIFAREGGKSEGCERRPFSLETLSHSPLSLARPSLWPRPSCSCRIQTSPPFLCPAGGEVGLFEAGQHSNERRELPNRRVCSCPACSSKPYSLAGRLVRPNADQSGRGTWARK